MDNSIALLNTTELNSAIENIFCTEQNFIIILSPYLSLTARIQVLLSISTANVIIIYSEKELENSNTKISEYQRTMPHVQFYCIPNFHAKAYVTNNTIIITSLNLYEHSQINNFELGILLKDNLYDQVIEKLFQELQIIFKMNNIDISILNPLKLPTINELFYNVLTKYSKNESDYPDAELLKQFSQQMMSKYTFDRNCCWKDNENILQRYVTINREMYAWALENIKL